MGDAAKIALARALNRAVQFSLVFVIFLLVAEFGATNEAAASGKVRKAGEWTYELFFPHGKGPFPIVIQLPGCRGWIEYPRRAMDAHKTFLLKHSYAVAQLDVLGPRKIKTICANLRLQAEMVTAGAAAATEVALIIASDSRVDKRNIIFMGASYGGIVALTLASPYERDHLVLQKIFTSIVAYYPYCRKVNEIMGFKADWDVPLLILSGEKDEWTPPTLCTMMPNRLKAVKPEIVIYPGAYHAFDHVGLGKYYEIAADGSRQLVVYNREATLKSRKKFMEFLNKTLHGN